MGIQKILRTWLSLQSDLEQAGVREENFPIAAPRAMGIRGWSLLAPIMASVAGFCAFAILAYSFTVWAAFTGEQLLPSVYRVQLVIVGAIALAVGGEIGTPATVVEVYRKNVAGEANVWDWSALGASLAATALTFLLAFGALLGMYASWSVVVVTWAPVALALVGALDAYSGMMEFGLFLGSFDQRYREWEDRRDKWMWKAANDVGLIGTEGGTQQEAPSWYVPPKEDKVLPPTHSAKRKPVERKKKKPKWQIPAPRGQQDIYAKEVEGGWEGICPDCAWMGKKLYTSKKNAILAVIAHKKACPGPKTEEKPDVGIVASGKVGLGEWGGDF